MSPGGEGVKAHVALADVFVLANVALTPEDEALVLAADGDDAEAQCDLALWLLEAGRAAFARDEAAGMLRLSQAAARSSLLGQALVAALHSARGQQARAVADVPALERLLDAVERQVLLRVLGETADPA